MTASWRNCPKPDRRDARRRDRRHHHRPRPASSPKSIPPTHRRGTARSSMSARARWFDRQHRRGARHGRRHDYANHGSTAPRRRYTPAGSGAEAVRLRAELAVRPIPSAMTRRSRSANGRRTATAAISPWPRDAGDRAGEVSWNSVLRRSSPPVRLAPMSRSRTRCRMGIGDQDLANTSISRSAPRRSRRWS